MNYATGSTAHCESCNCEIRDDGPEQTDAFLEGYCEGCHAAHVSCCSACKVPAVLDQFNWCATCSDKFDHTCCCCNQHFADASKLTDSANSGDLRCEKCEADHNSDMAERAEQQLFEDYHGGVAPDYVYEAMAAKGERAAEWSGYK